ncbi:MAG: CpXC domain-containing protein [Chitinophagales bacterium]|nr:CpXC domain-containing protein [Chitinophagales bacterium]
MKIKCTCEHIIVDQTDFLENKGYLIPDTKWFNFWDSIDKAIEESGPSPKEKEAACMQLRKQNIFKMLWECPNCGKLFIDGGKGTLILYSPDNKNYNKALGKK